MKFLDKQQSADSYLDQQQIEVGLIAFLVSIKIDEAQLFAKALST